MRVVNRKWNKENTGFRKLAFSLGGGGTKNIPISRPDILIDDKIIVELKAQENSHPVWEAQLLSYLKLTDKIKNQKFIGTNDIEYELTDSTLLIKANNTPISIAGLIPQKEFGYTVKTSSLLIEASVFNSSFIRKQSRSLGLRTERSARYEKSIKNTTLLEALYRFISLLRIENPKLICKVHTIAKPIKDPVRRIKVNSKKRSPFQYSLS